MKNSVYLLLAVMLSLTAAANRPSDFYCAFQVLGYYPDYFAAQLPVSQIPYDKLTEVVYFSIYPNPDGTLNQSEISPARQAQLIETAHANGVRVSICVGGWGLSSHFSAACADPSARAALVSHLTQYCLSNGFDGIDLDWEPVSTAADRQNYTHLIRQLKVALAPHGKTLSVAVFAQGNEFLPEAVADIDRLHIMAYDMRTPHSGWSDTLAGLDHWQSYGVPSSKIILGMPFYGRDSSWAFYGYKQIMEMYHPAPEVDEIAGINFNGLDTIRRKTRHVIENGYRGVMFWELIQDTTDHTSLLAAIADSAQQFLPPDLNCDDRISLFDLKQLLLQWFRADCTRINSWCLGADRNQSGHVDLEDVAVLGSNWTD